MSIITLDTGQPVKGLLNRQIHLEAARHILTHNVLRVVLLGLKVNGERAIKGRTPVYSFERRLFDSVELTAPETVTNKEEFDQLVRHARSRFGLSFVLIEKGKVKDSTVENESRAAAKPIQIAIKGFDGKYRIIECTPTTPVASLYATVAAKIGVSVNMLRLVFSAKSLNPALTLQRYKIYDGCTVHACIKLRGGMAHDSSHLGLELVVLDKVLYQIAAKSKEPLTVAQTSTMISKALARKPVSEE